MSKAHQLTQILYDTIHAYNTGDAAAVPYHLLPDWNPLGKTALPA